jgi:nitroalkane oxidase
MPTHPHKRLQTARSLADTRYAILILLITPGVIKNNKPNAYQVLSHPELAGHVASTGPHVKFANLRVPDQESPHCSRSWHHSCQAGFYLRNRARWCHVRLNNACCIRDCFEVFKAGYSWRSEPIIGRQTVANLLMNLKMNCDAARALTWATTQAVESGRGPEMALEAKIFCSDIAVKSGMDAMRAVGV